VWTLIAKNKVLGAICLIIPFVMVSSLVMPALSLQSPQIIQSNGSINYQLKFLYGVCAHPWALTERDFQEMQKLGVKYVRMDFSWSEIEPVENSFHYSKYDVFVVWARAYGIEIIPCLLHIPSWFPGGGDVNIPPYGADFDKLVTKFGQFTYNVVARYKADITYFEVWNEPDVPQFWRDPDGTRYRDFIHGEAIRKYTMLLNEAYTQAKAANPNCVIISGGIANDVNYLRGMYSYGAKFDMLGAHPYFVHSPTKNYDVDYIDPKGHEYQFPKIQYLRDIMVANGDSNKKIIITEIGIDDQLCPEHTTPPPSSPAPEGHTTEEMQADRLTRVFEKTLTEYPWIIGIMWYQLKDTHKAFGSVPVTSSNWGLFRMNGKWDPDYPNVVDYTPRLMYYAYKQFIETHNTP